jgi:hypothetical protein
VTVGCCRGGCVQLGVALQYALALAAPEAS